MAIDGQQDVIYENEEDTGLKYLGLVYLAALKAASLVGFLYEFAKENSGPLRPGVETVEGTVKTVVGPVYHKIEGKPLELLHFVDNKVDESLIALDARLPQYGKERLYQIYVTFHRTPYFVKSVITEVQKNGVYETARDYYVKYEPVAEDLSYNAWRNLLKLPLVPDVVNVVAPPTIFGAAKYNDVVGLLKNNDVPFASYIPMLPIEKMERAVKVQAD
ncbi:hypothetical protein O6H91_11G083300 [Diphasiastrum complanatum]|uniref:Uncharacterized protein n=1 Tax=Diphasiastrum complanatum TaxID=34168 RepID=A0ACC2CBD7_DIPCM|nr:hypothetical protein O6H91_11G083300 [Diphasiastrum complanatum]